MAQKILLRRGGIGNIGSTIAVSKGELIFASGSTNGVENVVFIANADGNNTFTPVNKLYTGTAGADTFSARLNGTPYYNTTSQSLHILTNGGTVTPLDLSGNLEGNTVSSMTISTLTNTTLNTGTVNASGDITGSNLKLTGNADITGNVTIGGNITVGDATTDFINFTGDISSSIVPDVDSAFDLGSDSQRWLNIYVDNVSGSTAKFASTVDIAGATTLTNTLSVAGQTNLNGNTVLGDAATDTVAFKADVSSSIIPSGNDLFDLGASSDRWRFGYFVSASIDSLQIGGIDPTAQDLDDVMNNGNSTNNDFVLNNNGNQSITHTGATGNLTISSRLNLIASSFQLSKIVIFGATTSTFIGHSS